ncbi:MAG: M1 family metallopeptidase, partial [Proteobacteria bacterium]|nr:M1 family metallopeptidase [Pseudomonadota bacterium]
MLKRLGAIPFLALAVAAQAAATDYPHGRLPAGVAPTHYTLTLAIDPREPRFSGRVDIAVRVAAPTREIWLHGQGLVVEAASASTRAGTVAARYAEVDPATGVAHLLLRRELPPGTATLHLRYHGTFQESPQGLFRTRAGGDWYAFSQFEATDARRAFPGFDEPGFKTPFDVAIIARAGDRAISNLPERRAVRVAGGRVRHEYATTPPLPTYLLAFAVGPLEVSDSVAVAPSAARGAPLPLRVVGTRGQRERFAFALQEAPALIRRLEDYFGTAFPYPKIDLIAAPMQAGAMENAGAIISAEDILLVGASPTPRQQAEFGVTIAHELAHQWFGDLVTPAWWDDTWLNESFAEWMGSRVANAWRPDLGVPQEQLAATLGAMATDALKAGRPIHQPVPDNRSIGPAFDEITYEKGAGVIGMVESYLGPEAFQRGVRLHLARHRHGTATAAEFFQAMADGSGEPAIIEAFRSFVDQPGVPLVTVRPGADGTLALEQRRYRPLGSAVREDALWQVPVCVRLVTAGDPARSCTLLTDRTGTLRLPAGTAGGIVHPNADGAGYYRFALEGEALARLAESADRLSPAEALVLADGTGAAFEAGAASFAELYGVARTLARHPDRTTALTLGLRLEDLHDRLADARTRALLERALLDLYGERLQRLGTDTAPGRYATESAERQLLRRQLVGLLALTGRDPALRAALAEAADRSVADPSAVEPLLRWRVWAVGVEERGLPMVERLKALAVESRDPAVRGDASRALGYAVSDEAVRAALALLLDPRADVDAVFGILFQLISHPASRATAWQWFTGHLDGALARMPDMFAGELAGVGSPFCSRGERDALETALGARMRRANGGALAMERTLERIDNCIALKAAVGEGIATALAAAHPERDYLGIEVH